MTGDVDAGGVGGGGTFAHSPQVQAGTSAVEHEGHDQCQNNGQIGQEAIVQEELGEGAELLGVGRGPVEKGAGSGQGHGGHVAVGQLDEGAAEEVAEANTEGGQGQTGDILVGPEGDGEEAVEKSHQQRAQQRACHGDGDGPEGDQGLTGHGLLIEEGADDAADGANVHDAGNAQIQVAGLLRQDLTGGAVQQRDALHHGTGEKGYEIEHDYLASFLALRKWS